MIFAILDNLVTRHGRCHSKHPADGCRCVLRPKRHSGEHAHYSGFGAHWW